MRRNIADLVFFALAAGTIAAIGAYLRPGRRELILDLYLLFVATLVLLALVHVTRRAGGGNAASVYEAALERPDPVQERLPALARAEREVDLATQREFDFHLRVRGSLREIAAHRLLSRRGLDLDGDPEEVRVLLGEDGWELLRPGREQPDDRLAPGPALSRLRALVERIERM